MINLLEVSVISFDLKLIVFNQQIMPYFLVVSWLRSFRTLILNCLRWWCCSFLYSMCSFWVPANTCRSFIVCLYMYWHWRSNYQEGRVWIPLICLTRPHVCVSPKLDLNMSWYFFLCSMSWGEIWLLALLILEEALIITV